MRIVIAQMKHETNTFSPVEDADRSFRSRGAGMPRLGTDAIAAARAPGSALGAFISVVEKAGPDYALPIAASAFPSGPAEDEVFEYIAAMSSRKISRGCDAILLDLHGAMVTRSLDDAEGELLRRVRTVAPRVPIGVALDMHCNLSPAMAELATVITGYQTYPHVDISRRAIRAAAPILAMLEGVGQAGDASRLQADAAPRHAAIVTGLAQSGDTGPRARDGAGGRSVRQPLRRLSPCRRAVRRRVGCCRRPTVTRPGCSAAVRGTAGDGVGEPCRMGL